MAYYLYFSLSLSLSPPPPLLPLSYPPPYSQHIFLFPSSFYLTSFSLLPPLLPFCVFLIPLPFSFAMSLPYSDQLYSRLLCEFFYLCACVCLFVFMYLRLCMCVCVHEKAQETVSNYFIYIDTPTLSYLHIFNLFLPLLSVLLPSFSKDNKKSLSDSRVNHVIG